MAISSTSLYRSDDPYETLIANMIRLEREPQYRLQADHTEKKRLRTVLSDADSKISALHKLVEQFNDALSNPFETRAVTLPPDAAFRAAASDTAAYGSHSLMVERLARSDARVSAQRSSSLTGAGSLREVFDNNGGSQTFTIEVAAPTDADPAARYGISVSVSPTGTTDKEVMAEISRAINAAMDQAVTDGHIKAGEKATASVVNETSGTTRLSIRSGQTGYTNRLAFTDSPAGLLSSLELTNNAPASGTGGGQLVTVGTSELDSELNSKFVLNGLTLYRDKNEVSDALDGVTLSLTKVSGQAQEFSINPGAEKIKTEVEAFITKYNDVLKYIASKSSVDKDTKVRGDFASDTAFTSLRYGMRNDMARSVTGQPLGAPSRLADLGIEINEDGTLNLKDPDKLIAAVRTDAGGVQSYFSGADGLSERLSARLDQYVGVDSIIDQREKVLDQRIARLDKNIKAWDARMLQREEQLREQFARMQETIATLQGQQAYLFGF